MSLPRHPIEEAAKGVSRSTSKTATLAASVRAHHRRWNAAPIFADDYALAMLSPFWRLLVENRLLNWIVNDKLMGAFHPIHTEILLRIRYAEECLEDAFAAGVGQYVVLGAGLDTYALRQPGRARGVRVFELDHPATQKLKRERVRRIDGRLPSDLVLVPIDFETERLNEALAGTSFDPEAPAFFSWLGTTYYLSRDAIRETLACIALAAAPGSRIVLDYKLPRHLVPTGSRPLNDKLERLVKRLGEPMRSEFTPGELNDEMARIGFVAMDRVPPDEQIRRYLKDRNDVAEPAPNFSFALYGKPGEET